MKFHHRYGLVVILAMALAAGVSAQSGQLTASEYVPGEHDPINLAIHRSMNLPYTMTAGGQLFAPTENGDWLDISPQAAVHDLYIESGGRVWAATDSGLMAYENAQWRSIDNNPATRLESTHGFLFSMGPETATRLEQSREIDLTHHRLLEAPLADAPFHNLVMLGSHTHVLHIGAEVFQTLDVGLSWRPLNAPEPVLNIGTDPVGELLAVTEGGILHWHDDNWNDFLPLPEDQPIHEFHIFNNQLFVLAAGSIYQQVGNGWEKQTLPESHNAYFIALAVQYPDNLWALDAAGARLWFTADGDNWTLIPFTAREN